MKNNLFIENDLKNIIHESFPSLEISIYYEREEDSVFVSINSDDIYYSDKYQLIVMNLKINLLWAKDVYNFYFVVDKKSCCEKMISKISSNNIDKSNYIDWSLNYNVPLSNSNMFICENSMAA